MRIGARVTQGSFRAQPKDFELQKGCNALAVSERDAKQRKIMKESVETC